MSGLRNLRLPLRELERSARHSLGSPRDFQPRQRRGRKLQTLEFQKGELASWQPHSSLRRWTFYEKGKCRTKHTNGSKNLNESLPGGPRVAPGDSSPTPFLCRCRGRDLPKSRGT